MNCPACNRPFACRILPDQFVVWCATGVCSCTLANDGMEFPLPWTAAAQAVGEAKLADKVTGWLVEKDQ